MVDDEPLTLKNLRRILENEGDPVSTYNNPWPDPGPEQFSGPLPGHALGHLSTGETYRAHIGDLSLTVGDATLIHGTWKRLRLLQSESSLLFTTPVDVEQMRPEKAAFAGLCLAVALIMILVFKTQLSVCLMAGALGMILTGVLSIDKAYRSVDWRTIFLLAGSHTC